ncbi:metal ABC transporter permease [Luteolibacter pohnpeiensis]|uniref:Metal ABC transporter permease n=1 Tax=Luteolibacter pohnpeiensis TaxID=454153 RepID=A0A934VRF4_9BACT|nr:metal ABC transporter permease [Luteolibacter pohnpeiensis]MBK1883146.1 metal ABC transporter permease [Luteolibacter pohnpeiensis]
MSELYQQLLIPFQYDYMVRAILSTALIGSVCGFLSAFVTLKGWSLMGDALSHAVVPGVAVAYILGLPFAVGAFVAGLMAAGKMAFVKAKSRIREDATIGIVFTTFFAAGLLLISLYPARVDLRTILLGNILGISNPDMIQVLAISVVTLCVLGLKWRDLMLFCFDANQARALGLRTGWLHVLLLSLLAATAVAALQAVGSCLVVAMLVTPGATAYLLTDRFSRMLGLSSLLGLLSSVLGTYASYYLNGSTGGCIVSLQTLLFIGAFFWSPKHGFVHARRMVKQHQIES